MKHNLPPGQQLAALHKWPTVGEKASTVVSSRNCCDWKLSVTGFVEKPKVFSWNDLQAMPQTESSIDIHCVTRWSKFGMKFGGILLKDLLNDCSIESPAVYIQFVAESDHHHSTSLLLEEALQCRALLATSYDGKPLPVEHGGPLRLVVPEKYFYKSIKWLRAIELLEKDSLGTWEAEAGYNNHADPWKEERFMLPGRTKQEVARLIVTCNLQGANYPGLDIQGRDLPNLNAQSAVLRNANFNRSNLVEANFQHANLSGASFIGANLAGANFEKADLEGADFSGANLAGANFRSAMLLATSFCSVTISNTRQNSEALNTPDNFFQPAVFDESTYFDSTAMDALMPAQQDFMRRTFKKFAK